jgi:small GTP-binding protein
MPRAALERVLEELLALADGRVHPKVAELARRLREDRLRVLVVGEAKRGKSTLVNALLGRPVLPTGVTPLTAIATTLTYGAPERVEVGFEDGRGASYPLSALEDLVTETGNPHNRRGLASVIVRVDAPLLASGIELVDTPGTGSVFEHNTRAARQALEAMDAAVFVLTADPPVSQAELDLLGQVDAASVATFVLLNKADRLDAAEREQAAAFAAQVAARSLGREVRVYPCSARTALLDGSDPGLAAFLGDFQGYLRRERAQGLAASVARQAGELAGQLRDGVRLTLRADELSTGAKAARVDEFRSRVASIDVRRQDASDTARAQIGHFLA